MKNYSFLNTAIIRTPLGEKQLDLTWEKILEIFSKKENREALYIGSPTIHSAFLEWEKDKKNTSYEELNSLKISLYKYASRLSNRCTPFGLFATVSTANFNKVDHIKINESTLKRITKFDMYFLGRLLPIIMKEQSIKEVLVYKPNNSIYKNHDKYRYVEYYFKKNIRYHTISEVEITPYLEIIIKESQKGIRINEIVKTLISDEISQENALDFINTLIENQFLVSELEFTLTGQDYFEKLTQTFSEKRFDFYEANVILKLIHNLKLKLNELDKNTYNDHTLYDEIHSILDGEINDVEKSKLFQVDSFRKINDATISYNTLKSIRPAITVLNKLNTINENAYLKEFKRKFQERFEEYEQPLVAVLDPETGIGYGPNKSIKTPLIDDLKINGAFSNVRQINFNSKKKYLFKKLLEATSNHQNEIEIIDQEINVFNENETLYPDTFSVFCNLLTDNDVEKIHLKYITGPTANALIGRFGHLDTSLLSLSNEIYAIEEELHNDKIIAEIVHLPQARTGNVLYRNSQRKFEIPYLGNASVNFENQILIDDLMVSVNKYGEIILRSKRLNKRILPRLSNAHNYSSNALPIYHFLCDLQNQKSSGFGFNWGELQNEFDFLPRVNYKNIILSKATWNINKVEIDHLLSLPKKELINGIRTFRNKRNIPQIINVTQGDNEMLINFDNDLSCEVFFSLVKKSNFIQLTEVLFRESSITDAFCNEIIVSAHKNLDKKDNSNSIKIALEKEKIDIKSSFSIGDKWLSYKFYCGEKASEQIINEVILPSIIQLNEENLIEKWFFIRYKDAIGSHVRFRILVKDINLISKCIRFIKLYSNPFEDSKIIWKIQTDNYLREIQRYGKEAIKHTESLFFNDSVCTINFLNLIEGEYGEKIRWLFSLLSIDQFLNDLKFDLKEKCEILKIAKISFGKEFNKSKTLNKQINELYSKNEIEIDNFLDDKNIDEEYIEIWSLINERSLNNKKPINEIIKLADLNKLPATLSTISISYIHMICNRIFVSKQRVHEMVVYDFLYKYYSKKIFLNT